MWRIVSCSRQAGAGGASLKAITRQALTWEFTATRDEPAADAGFFGMAWFSFKGTL